MPSWLRSSLPGLFVEQTQHHSFAIAGGQGGDAHVHRTVADLEGDAAILRHALLGDIELCHDLDAGDQIGGDIARRMQHFAQ